MTYQPLVSVVVPNYNYAHFLPQCIDSVLVQTYTNWELIIVDDNSSDNSRDIIMDYVKRYPQYNIRFFHNQTGPAGTSVPLNIGIREMKGEIFAWLSSDDVFHPDKILRQVEVLEKNPDVGMVYTRVSTIDDDGKIIGLNTFACPPSRADFFLELMKRNFVNGNTVMVRKETLDKIGPFVERTPEYVDIWRADDYFSWLKICLVSRIIGVNERLNLTRKHRGNNDFNSCMFWERLNGLLFSMIVKKHDIHDLAKILDIPESQKIYFESRIRRWLGVSGYTGLIIERHNHMLELDPQFETEILQKTEDLTRAEYLVKNADVYILTKPALAAQLLEEALSLNNRSDIRPIYTLASFAKRDGNIEKAITLFNEVLQKDFYVDSPFVTGSHFHLGEIDLNQGKQTEAVNHFKACLNENPSHRKAAEYLQSLGIEMKNNV